MMSTYTRGMSEKTSIFALASESDIWWLKRGSGLFNCCQRVVKILSRYPSVIKQLLEKFLVCSGGRGFWHYCWDLGFWGRGWSTWQQLPWPSKTTPRLRVWPLGPKLVLRTPSRSLWWAEVKLWQFNRHARIYGHQITRGDWKVPRL